MKLLEIKHLQAYPIRHQVMWPNKPLDYIKIKGDEDALHFGIEQDDTIVSVVSLFISCKSAQLRKLATQADYRNRSYASLLIKKCIEKALEHHCESIWLNARSTKTSFYEHFGFNSTNEKFEKGGISYQIMKLKLR